MFANLTLRVFNSSSRSFFKTVPSVATPKARLQAQLRHFSITPQVMATEWKLKSISSLADIKDNDKVESEVEGIDGGKVLLVKVGGKVHGLNPNCSHYGAPLKNGVVSPDGRITCPWHGACFNVSTGDVEDAPGPAALHHFDVEEKNGAVYVKGQEKSIKEGKRSVNIKTQVTEPEKLVIVGSGSGAFGAIMKLRELGYKGHTTVISIEGKPIDRTKLSKALITDANKLYWYPDEWYQDGQIEFINDSVTSIDFSSRNIKTKTGKSYPYNKLILSTGGNPKNLPLPGFKELGNIFLLRKVSDAQNIMNAVGNKGKNIVVIGSSFIGMEVANCLAKENTVTVVGMEKAPLERVMGEQVGQVFRKNLEKNGVKFRMEAGVDSALPASSIANAVGMSSVGAVKLKDGTELPADLVIMGVGVGPATEYLQDNSEVKLEKDGSVTVDEQFAVKGLSEVWAIGDIATYPYNGPGGEGKPVRIEHWNVAQNAGRTVGQLIAQPNGPKPKPFIPIFWSALGAQLRYCGGTYMGYDDVVIKGNTDEAKFAAYYTKEDTVVACATMGMDPVMTKVAELMRRGEMISKSDINSGKDVLEVNL